MRYRLSAVWKNSATAGKRSATPAHIRISRPASAWSGAVSNSRHAIGTSTPVGISSAAIQTLPFTRKRFNSAAQACFDRSIIARHRGTPDPVQSPVPPRRADPQVPLNARSCPVA
ncbi:hypothetical protein [Burkholderia cepacia]|uniref:hypothetical protein n=1 Tax=Burkholderia cepacia TaxID=292 RepID=UPI00158E7D24|nr:hypothetical protein [Burkholderia cepacia]MCA8131685.1 hypothetical protein [Burkholderia cepacia]MCA8159764.1 hypothetical protein [Burkholderia cepacia]HEM7889332.1 hypothetical protein [Burkholderia cepacia]HEM8509767.1 hypothetical protein [Burkholderia cepacia]